MAESDPRKSRAFAQRAQAPDQSEDDPLVELARIVGEDNAYYGGRAGKARSGQEDGQARGALSANLESELLTELESSLSRGSPQPAAAPAPRQIIRPSRAEPEPDPEPEDGDELMRSIEEQLGAFERRQQAARPVQSAAPSQPPHWSSRTEQLRGGQFAPQTPDSDAAQRHEQQVTPRAPVGRPTQRQQSPVLRAAAAPDPGALPGGPVPGGVRTEQSAVRGSQLRSRGEPESDEPGRAASVQRGSRVETFAPPQRQVPLRPDRAAEPGVRATAAVGWNGTAQADDGQDVTDAGWTSERGAGARSPHTTFDETSSAAARSAHIEAELSRELESGYSDPTAAGSWPEPDVQPGPESMNLSGAGSFEADHPSKRARRRRSRRGLLVLASLLGLALAGGGVAAYLRAGEALPSAPPPVIAAPQGAVKIQPPAPQQQAAAETVGEAVYNRVAGAAQPTQEQVVEGAEEPEEISRIVLPPPDPPAPVADPAEADASAVTRSAGPEGEPNAGPRRVRTYVVRPDGTIVASEEAPAAATSEPTAAEPSTEELPEQQVAALEAAGPAAPTTVPVTEINEAPDPEGGVAAAEAPASAEPVVAAAAEAEADPGAALTDLAPSQAPDAPGAPQAETTPPAAAPAADVASAPGAAPAAAAPAAGGHFVQVSSQRNMDQAQSSFAGMKRQFPSILGPLSADIQEADLGAKGKYFRVRVGPYATRGEAIKVCEELKAAGGSCIVTQ